ncbi:uncharacterized protein LOC109863967 isoform X2 [Pseudomyrmex gracilis]|uniref:uncharacterized protein LOC109863967 isoform X2 n=1 Tax=Pseudomyrmex gracilis TaxID=219809 RepID=UPI000995D35D|nr:uncharacterized protein LOC109863967 isoform X2 [Pseudomyrmex gracilis]
MFVCRELLLAVTILSTSIVLADILVQPGYEHQYNTDLQYQTFGVRDTSQQFHNTYYGESPSNLQLVSYPHHYYHRPYYHRYQHPSTYYHRTSIQHHQQAPSHYYTVTAHHRYKRSPDSTNAESNKTTIASRDAVPTISTLDDSLMTTIMPPPYLYHKQTMDTITNRRVENSPSEKDHSFRLTGLLGLNPNNMLSQNRQIKSQQLESDKKQYSNIFPLLISSSKNTLRQRKHHNQAISHTPSVTDGSSKPTVGTVSTTKVCFNNTRRKNNMTFSFTLPSSNGLSYSLILPVDPQQTTDNYDSNTLDGNNIPYYINTGASSYLIPKTYKSLNFRPFQGVSANYYPVSPRNLAPQRYVPNYVIPMTYTSPNVPSVQQISTYNYPVSPRCIAPQTYYSIYPSTYNNVPYVYQTFSSPAYY